MSGAACCAAIGQRHSTVPLRPRCLSCVFNAVACSDVASVTVATLTATLASMRFLLCPVYFCLAAGQRYSFSCKLLLLRYVPSSLVVIITVALLRRQ
jgi:hypothetical protein